MVSEALGGLEVSGVCSEVPAMKPPTAADCWVTLETTVLSLPAGTWIDTVPDLMTSVGRAGPRWEALLRSPVRPLVHRSS